MLVSTPLMGADRPEEWIYGEKKFGKQFMLTKTASDLIEQKAKELEISRSEVIERVVRGGGLQAANHFKPDQSKDPNAPT